MMLVRLVLLHYIYKDKRIIENAADAAFSLFLNRCFCKTKHKNSKHRNKLHIYYVYFLKYCLK